MKKWEIIERYNLGGEHSGHHGHKGVPGQRGGSAPSAGGGDLSSVKKINGETAKKEWVTQYPGEEGPTVWEDVLMAYRDSKPVAYLSYYDEEVDGIHANHIGYVKSHAPGAGRELIQNLIDRSDVIYAEAQTTQGLEALKSKGFLDISSLVGVDRAGLGMIFIKPALGKKKLALVSDYLEESDVPLEVIGKF